YNFFLFLPFSSIISIFSVSKQETRFCRSSISQSNSKSLIFKLLLYFLTHYHQSFFCRSVHTYVVGFYSNLLAHFLYEFSVVVFKFRFNNNFYWFYICVKHKNNAVELFVL